MRIYDLSPLDPKLWKEKDWLTAIQMLADHYNCWGYQEEGYTPLMEGYTLQERDRFDRDLTDLIFASRPRSASYNVINHDARKVVQYLRKVKRKQEREARKAA